MSWKTILKWSVGILLIILLFFFLGNRIERVESYSMASTILPGQRVIVKNMKPKLVSRLEVGDIVEAANPGYYDTPIKKKPRIISRIAALPGDTLILWDKVHYINRKIIDAPETVRRIYRVVTDSTDISAEFLESYDIESPMSIADIGMWDILMDTLAYEELSKAPNVKNIRSMKMYAGDSSSKYWPYSGYFIWNRDQVGPLIVPYQGLRVEINLKSIDEYKRLIELYEGNEVIVNFAGVKINGRDATEYVFKNDYYYVLDDNRGNPQDSRILGYIPKSHILGKVNRTIWNSLK